MANTIKNLKNLENSIYALQKKASSINNKIKKYNNSKNTELNIKNKKSKKLS